MRALSTFVFIFWLVAPPPPCATAQKGAGLQLSWARNAKEARTLGVREGRPIAVCFIQKKCRTSMKMIRKLHEDGRIYELKNRFVWLCVEPSRKEDFKWFICECGDAVEGTPTFFFLSPKGQYADPALACIDPVTGADPDRIISTMRQVLSRFKVKIERLEQERYRTMKVDAFRCARNDPCKAISLLRSVIAGSVGWPSMEETVLSCKGELETIVRQGLGKIRKILRTKEPRARKAKALAEVKAAYPDTAASHWAGKEMERLRVKPVGKSKGSKRS